MQQEQEQELDQAELEAYARKNVLLNPKIDGNDRITMEPIEETPAYWKNFIANCGIRILQHAVNFGLIIPEYTMKDYILYALKVRGGGYELIDIWGRQGSRKSCRTLACSYWAYQDWDTVLKEMVLLPDARELPDYLERGFLQKMQAINKDEYVPLVAWDDITVGMPSASFRTDVQQYAAVDSAFAAIRTKMRVVIANNPLIDRLTKNIKDNITMECFIGTNQLEEILRFIRLPSFKNVNSNFFKIPVEPLHRFNWRVVPSDVFQEYFDIRKEIADYAVHKMGKAFGDEAAILEEMVGYEQMWKESPIALSTLNDMLKRNFIPTERINGKVYVRKTVWEMFLEKEAEKPTRHKRG